MVPIQYHEEPDHTRNQRQHNTEPMELPPQQRDGRYTPSTRKMGDKVPIAHTSMCRRVSNMEHHLHRLTMDAIHINNKRQLPSARNTRPQRRANRKEKLHHSPDNVRLSRCHRRNNTNMDKKTSPDNTQAEDILASRPRIHHKDTPKHDMRRREHRIWEVHTTEGATRDGTQSDHGTGR